MKIRMLLRAKKVEECLNVSCKKTRNVRSKYLIASPSCKLPFDFHFRIMLSLHVVFVNLLPSIWLCVYRIDYIKQYGIRGLRGVDSTRFIQDIEYLQGNCFISKKEFRG